MLGSDHTPILIETHTRHNNSIIAVLNSNQNGFLIKISST